MNENIQKRKKTLLDRPYLAASLFMFFSILILFWICPVLGHFVNENWGIFALPLVVAIVFMLLYKLCFRKSLKSIASFSFLSDRKVVLSVILFEVVDVIVTVVGCVRCGFAAPTMVGLIQSLMAGFGEELSYRLLPISIMMRTYKDKNKYLPALIFTSVIFGVYHMTNILSGASLEASVLQTISAAVAGLFFAALYVRTGSIVLPVIIHALHDLFSSVIASQAALVLNFTPSAMDYVEVGTTAIIQILLTIWLLKGHKEDIIKKWQEMWK